MLDNFKQLAAKIKSWGKEIGFQRIGIIAPEDSSTYKSTLQDWVKHEYCGTMKFMTKNVDVRLNPKLLMPEVQSIICCSLSYNTFISEHILQDKDTIAADSKKDTANIAEFALGEDYHKVMLARLTELAQNIEKAWQILPGNESLKIQYRIFCDSAPLLEKALAARAGLGWIGKNTLLIDKDVGSKVALGEIFINLPLPADEENHTAKSARSLCGECRSCLEQCPTKALRSAYLLDARRCLAYLTIEHRGPIPIKLRPLMSTNIFGCDICQKCCPYNSINSVSQQGKEVTTTTQKKIISSISNFCTNDSNPCHRAKNNNWRMEKLSELFLWDEPTFVANTDGTALQRLGYDRWLRNLAVALGNASKTPANFAALQTRLNHQSELVREHVTWALKQYEKFK